MGGHGEARGRNARREMASNGRDETGGFEQVAEHMR